jgi:hypothetical protein
MWMSVPQMVVVVMRMSASNTPFRDRHFVERDPGWLDKDRRIHFSHPSPPEPAISRRRETLLGTGGKELEALSRHGS